MTTDIKTALDTSQETLTALRLNCMTAESGELLFICDQFQNVLTQLAEEVKWQGYRIEHLEGKTGHTTLGEIYRGRKET